MGPQYFLRPRDPIDTDRGGTEGPFLGRLPTAGQDWRETVFIHHPRLLPPLLLLVSRQAGCKVQLSIIDCLIRHSKSRLASRTYTIIIIIIIIIITFPLTGWLFFPTPPSGKNTLSLALSCILVCGHFFFGGGVSFFLFFGG